MLFTRLNLLLHCQPDAILPLLEDATNGAWHIERDGGQVPPSLHVSGQLPAISGGSGTEYSFVGDLRVRDDATLLTLTIPLRGIDWGLLFLAVALPAYFYSIGVTGKEAFIPLSGPAILALDRYLTVRRLASRLQAYAGQLREPFRPLTALLSSPAWLLPLFVALVGALATWWVFARLPTQLAARGHAVLARVDSVQPTNHESVYFSYRVGKVVYEAGSQGGSGAGNPSIDGLRPGDSIRVWYLPDRPGAALPGEPMPDRNNQLVFTGMAFVVCLIATIGFRREWAKLAAR